MARRSTYQPPLSNTREEQAVIDAVPEAPASRLTPADLGYKPGEVVSLHDLNRLVNQ